MSSAIWTSWSIRPDQPRARPQRPRGGAHAADQRERLVERVRAAPHRFVGQEVLPLSSAPTSEHDRLVRRSVVLRSFTVRSGDSYAAMLGGSARVTADTDKATGVLVTEPDGGLPRTSGWSARRRSSRAGRHRGCASWASRSWPTPLRHRPRWCRACWRPVLVRPLRRARRGSAPAHPGHPHGGYRGRSRHSPRAERWTCCCRRSPTSARRTPASSIRGPTMMPELRAMLLDRHRNGTAAQAIGSLSRAAQGVRDQLSDDVWMVLADMERALAALAANPYDQGLQLTDVSRAGAVRPAGAGRHRQREHGARPRLVHARLRSRAGAGAAGTGTAAGDSLCRAQTRTVERMVIEAVLTADRVDRHVPSPLSRPDRDRRR